MTFSPWTLGSTRLGGRQEIGTFGIKSSVRPCCTEEFANNNKKYVCFLRSNCSCYCLLIGYRHQVHQVVVPMMREVVKTEIPTVWTLPHQALLPISITVPVPRRPSSVVVLRRRPLRSAAFRPATRWNRGLRRSAVLRQLPTTTLRPSPTYRPVLATPRHCCDLTLVTC